MVSPSTSGYAAAASVDVSMAAEANPTAKEDHAAHKKRQRARKMEQKRSMVDDLIQNVPFVDAFSCGVCKPSGGAMSSPSTSASTRAPSPSIATDDNSPAAGTTLDGDCNGSRSDIIPPPPLLLGSEGSSSSASMWENMPVVLTPDDCELSTDLTSLETLAKENTRQIKYAKKLQKKLQEGDIDQVEFDRLLSEHGRSASTMSSDNSTKFSLLSGNRGLRKRQQVENFAELLKMHMAKVHRDRDNAEQKITVVDFGCGSGNLCLPLAWLFPDVNFVLVDRNKESVSIAQNRAQQGGLKNLRVALHELSWEDGGQHTNADGSSALDTFPALSAALGDTSAENAASNSASSSLPFSFDLGIGLHCCGDFTDLVMHICSAFGASCIVCPCCNGKVSVTANSEHAPLEIDGAPVCYPRSRHVGAHLSREQYTGPICRAADDLGNYPAKCLIEYDRAMWAFESGRFATVQMFRLNPLSCSPKHHVIYCYK